MQVPKERLDQAFNRLYAMPDGILLLREIMRVTSYQKSSVSVNPETKDVNINASLYNSAQQDVWLHIRRFFNNEQLAKIENGEF